MRAAHTETRASVEATSPSELSSASLVPRGAVHPSPLSWRDQVLYFVLPDRFSDGHESLRPRFDRAQPAQFRAAGRRAWMGAGLRFQGGTLKGIASKLGYLRDLGVSALWVGPVFRQRADLQTYRGTVLETYHGYGIQNFLDVDPRFGTCQDLRDLVDAAHAHRMYVVLDVIYNHSGNNWFYDVGGDAATMAPYRAWPPYPFHGWRSAKGQSTRMIVTLDDGVWPREFQDPAWYTRAGQVRRWDPEPGQDPLDPGLEFRRGDFFDLKDFQLGRDDVVGALVRVYQYWIALSDCDGFRVDTVRHVPRDVSKHFCGAIHEYAESIGKDNFLILGEVTGGGRMAREYLDVFGRNLDAVLDIGAPAEKLAAMVNGLCDPVEFFNQFQGHDVLGTHRQVGRYHVSILDDHDMVGRGKRRFAADDTSTLRDQRVANAVSTQFTTLGIPCVYYGTEQSFDGTETRHDATIEPLNEDGSVPLPDRYIRETMFGGTFGAFQTAGCHFFDPDHPTYLRIAAVARVRNRQDMIGLSLRRGRQYLREIAVASDAFALPRAGQMVAWSRILHQQEVLVAVNPSETAPCSAKVTVDRLLHPPGSPLTVLFRAEWSNAQLRNPPPEPPIIVHQLGERAWVTIDLPAAGMVILA
jgi:glycosidase